MPTINLTDTLGLALDGTLVQGAKLTSILQSFTRLADLRLNEVAVHDLSSALNLAEPIDLPGGLGLKIGGGGGGRFALIGPPAGVVNAGDPFGAIPVRDDERYLCLALTLSLSTGLSASAGQFAFGLSAEHDFEVRCYRRFQRGSDGFPKFSQAFAATAASFFVPRRAGDLAELQPDAVVVVQGTGTLSISAGISVAFPTESLASVSVAGQTLQLSAGGQAGLSAVVTIGGGYQVRLRRLPSAETELGVYTTRSRETDLSISANVGVTAGVGSFDALERVIGVLSQQPAVDTEEFKRALPGEDDSQKNARIDGFQSSLKTAISTKLEASVKATLTSLQSHESMWMFAVNPSLAVSDLAQAAITAAMAGHFDSITRDPLHLPAGIRQIENVFTDTDLHKLTVKVNLLGLVNLLSAASLVKVTSIVRNANGDITLITDTSSASRLQALLVNFGNDHKRVRKLLSENFLIEAAYRANDLGVLPPEYKAKHVYFEIHDSTGRAEMKDNLDVARILGLMTFAEVQQRLGTSHDFGRTDFYAETRYTSDAVRAAFLQPQGLPPSSTHYEQIGRSALAALLMDDEGQDFRKRVAQDDDLWKELKKAGNRAVFAPLFGLPAGSADPRVEAAGADFAAIRTWADAMTDASSAIRELDALLAGGSIGPTDPKLTSAREILKKRLGDVVKNTKDQFGDPLGMIMFYSAANESGDKTILITGPQIPRLELNSANNVTARAGS